MAKDKDVDENQEGGEGSLPSGKKPAIVKILIFVIAGVILVGVAVIAAYMMSGKQKDEALKANQKDAAQESITIQDSTLYGTWLLSKGKEPMKFNLMKEGENGRESLLLANIELAWKQTNEKKPPEVELELRRAQLKSIVVQHFSTLTRKEADINNLNIIEKELLTKINSVMSDDVEKISKIFFTDYFIQ